MEALVLNNEACTLIGRKCCDSAIMVLNKALMETSQSPSPDMASDQTKPTPCKSISDANQHGDDIHPSMHYYPDNTYDEGMTAFSQPLRFGEVCNGSTPHRLKTEAVMLFNLGIAHSRKGDENETRICMKKSFDIQQQRAVLHPDPNHLIDGPSLCAILHNIGHSYWRCGRYAAAILSYERALDLLYKRKSENRLEISSTLNCIAIAKYHASDQSFDDTNNYDGILSILTNALNLRLSFPNPQFDRETATIINNIGRVRYSCGEFSVALNSYRKAHSYRVAALGEDHMDVAASLFNMAKAEEYQGHLPEAIELYRKFLPISTSHKGEGSREVANVLLILGDLSCKIGEIDQAYRFFTRSLKSSKLAYGQNSDPVATVLSKIGNVLCHQGRLDLALETYQSGLALQRILYSSNSTSNAYSHNKKIADLLFNIARIYRHMGRMDEALASCMEALAITRHYRHDEATARTLVEVASIHEASGEKELTVKTLEEAVHLYRILQNQDRGDPLRHGLLLASTLNNLGLAQIMMGRGLYSSALSSFMEVIKMHESLLSRGARLGFRGIAAVYFNAATIYKEIGKGDKALELYRETLRLEQMKCHGNDTFATSSDPPIYKDMALVCCRIAELLKDSGAFDEALEHLNFCYEICTEHLNGTTVDSPSAILKLAGDLYLQIGEIGRAMESYAAAMRMSHSPTLETNISHQIGIFAIVSESNPPTAAAAA